MMTRLRPVSVIYWTISAKNSVLCQVPEIVLTVFGATVVGTRVTSHDQYLLKIKRDVIDLIPVGERLYNRKSTLLVCSAVFVSS